MGGTDRAEQGRLRGSSVFKMVKGPWRVVTNERYETLGIVGNDNRRRRFTGSFEAQSGGRIARQKHALIWDPVFCLDGRNRTGDAYNAIGGSGDRYDIWPASECLFLPLGP
jgi:hypothetical protein